jgi:hypothetical protein
LATRKAGSAGKKTAKRKAALRKPAPRKAAPRKPTPRKAAARKSAAGSGIMPEALLFAGIFMRLRAILVPYAKHMHVKHDLPGLYYLETIPVPKYGEEVFFGAVQVTADHVSFHLLPVDVFPELLESISPRLRAHLQGSTCFNFRTIQPDAFNELKALTRAGFDGYKRGGVVGR